MDIICKVNKLDDGIIKNFKKYLGMHPVARIVEHNIIDKYFDNFYEEYLDVYCGFMFGSD